jgi:GNAT superfamily N-acetyltransferase
MITVLSSAEYQFTQEERDELFEIMRDAYARTEHEVWGENYVRLSQPEYNQLIDEGSIFGAKLDGQIIGTIYLKKISDAERSFSLFGVHSKAEGKGVGSRLIEAVEDRARKDGAEDMIIDILRVRDTEVPSKKRLRSWYEKLGYEFTHNENFQDRIPHRAHNLKAPSIFECFRKKLTE